MPTSAIFIVTHNIEEAILLADRVIVLGRNPARVRADFAVELPQPRERKSRRFVELVDYVYKVMTQPDLALACRTAEAAASKSRPQNTDAAACPRGWYCWPARAFAGPRWAGKTVPAGERSIMDARRLFPSWRLRFCSASRRLRKAMLKITPEGARFAEAEF